MGNAFLQIIPLGRQAVLISPLPPSWIGTATFLTQSIAVADTIEQIGASSSRPSRVADVSHFVQCARVQKKALATGARAEGRCPMQRAYIAGALGSGFDLDQVQLVIAGHRNAGQELQDLPLGVLDQCAYSAGARCPLGGPLGLLALR